MIILDLDDKDDFPGHPQDRIIRTGHLLYIGVCGFVFLLTDKVAGGLVMIKHLRNMPLDGLEKEIMQEWEEILCVVDRESILAKE